MDSHRDDFPISTRHYLDSASRSIPPKYENWNNFTRDYTNSIFKPARDQLSIYLGVKELLAEYIDGDAANIALLPNREIAWNMVLQGIEGRTARTTWSEESVLYTPLSLNFDLVQNQADVLAYSSIDPLTGERRQFQATNGELKVVDASYDLSVSDIKDYQADIIISELSIDLLSPFPVSMIYLNTPGAIRRNPFPSSGNVVTFEEDAFKPREDIQKFEIGQIDTKILRGLQNSLNYLENIGKSQIRALRLKFRESLVSELADLNYGTTLTIPHNNSSEHGFHLSLQTPHPAHDIALLLEETNQVEVRSGRMCTHLAMDTLGIDDAIRISWHIYNDQSDIEALITGLDQISTIFG